MDKVYSFKDIGLGVILIENVAYNDDRGFFMESYNKEAFEAAGIKSNFTQYNISQSKPGVLRGMHFQKEPKAQAKLVRCMAGEIFDVAIDARKDSKAFGKYVSVRLSGCNTALCIPRGFAHGFVALGDEDVIVMYGVDNGYSPELERGVAWNDEDIGIKWPIKPTLISKKDASWPKLKDVV
jgi:dTDP-4-dehydrorhamnose 3,5-epimerase